MLCVCVAEIFGRQHNTHAGWLTVGNQLEGVRVVDSEIAENLGLASLNQAEYASHAPVA